MCTLLTQNICLMCHVQTLWLSNNKISDAGLTALAKAVESGALPQLKELSLDSNKIGDAGLTALAKAVESGALPQLKKLHLYKNQIGDVGMQALAGAVSKGALDKLTVSWRATPLSACLETLHVHSHDSENLLDVPCTET